MLFVVKILRDDKEAGRFLRGEEKEKIVHLNKFIIRAEYKRSSVYEITETIGGLKITEKFVKFVEESSQRASESWTDDK